MISSQEIKRGASGDTVQCQVCKGMFLKEIILMRQIVSYEDSSRPGFNCFACLLRERADATIMTEGPQERFRSE